MQRRQKVRFFAGKVYIEPAPGLGNGVRFLLDAFFRQIAGKVLLTVKPQAPQTDLVRRKQDTAHRRVIMPGENRGRVICHWFFLRFLFSAYSLSFPESRRQADIGNRKIGLTQ